jgi:hypothetical protein
MNSFKPQRQRGRILSDQGWKKLQDALWKRYREDYTKKQLSELTGLDSDTVTKILRREEGVDKRSIKRLFSPFGLQLHESNDLTYPPQGARSHSAEVLQRQEQAQEETPSKNTDFVGREDAIAESTPEKELDELVEKVRSHFNKKIQNWCQKLDVISLSYTPLRKDFDEIYIDNVKLINESLSFNSTQLNQEPQLWEEVVLSYPKLMVLGKPGAGKTTLLKHIAIHCDELDFQPKLVPVFVSLQKFAEIARDTGKFRLLDYIQEKYCSQEVSEEEFKTLFSSRRFVFLLDGLDEIPEEQSRKVLMENSNFFNNSEGNRFIVTCRKEFQGYKNRGFGGFNFFEIADFKQEQIEDFIQKWFTMIPDIYPNEPSIDTTNLINQLSENQHVRELAGTPLLLHLICLVFHAEGDLPSKSSDLYSKGIHLLLIGWNRFNERNQWDISDRDLPLVRKTLRQIAARTFEQGYSSFKEEQIQDILANGPRTLSDIRGQYGLLVERGWQASTYTFSHQTFQEYLTAEAFVNSARACLEKLMNHITNPHWREVFLLAAEMLQPACELIRLMKKKIDQLPEIAEDRYLQYFLIEVRKKSRSASISHLYYRTEKGKRKVNSARFSASYRAFLIASVLDLNLTAERAFWDVESLSFGYTLDQSNGVSTPFDEIYSYRNWNFANNLSSAFTHIRESAYSPISALEVTHILGVDINDYLLQLLNPLKRQIDEQRHNGGSGKTIGNWWNSNGKAWTEELKKVMRKYRDICQDGKDWKFKKQQVEALRQYYDANHLLLECLERAFHNYDVTTFNQEKWEQIEKQWNQVYEEIEETLLLPIAEIE